MALSIKRYVLITSGVGAGAAVPQREFIGRLFNDNPLIPANGVLEFTSSDDVGAYFGFASPEYKRSVFYFGFVSKSITSPQKISFARYAKALAPARIYGGKSIASLATFNTINAGTLNMHVGGQDIAVVGIDVHAAVSLAAVAAAVQVAVRAAGGTQFVNALVTYDAVGGKFDFTASIAGAAAILETSGTMAPLLGWTDSDAIYSPGVDVQTIDAALAASAAISNNFGSFAFLTAPNVGEQTTAAAWNDAQNTLYIGCFAVPDDATAETLFAAITALSGNAITLAPLATEYPEMCPMILFASTDYTRRGAVKNYMYQVFNLTPSVSVDTEADTLDGVRCNYYGVTQDAGQLITFYQTGVLTGGPTAPSAMNVYANEAWFKDAAQTALLTALLGLEEIPANASGVSQLHTILQGPIDQALFNGVISVNKTLTPAQQLFVTTASGDPNAWRQVQSQGYWIGIAIIPVVTDGVTTYVAEYTLIYSKNDTVRKVIGTHALI